MQRKKPAADDDFACAAREIKETAAAANFL
jgi:hypothetical protein